MYKWSKFARNDEIYTCFFIVFGSFVSFGHEYFFGFAEMEYNAESKVYEGTLMLSTHDLEEWLQVKGIEVDELEDVVSGSKLENDISKAIFLALR